MSAPVRYTPPHGVIFAAHLPSKTTMQTLPYELLDWIYSSLDVPLVCRLYAAFPGHQFTVPAGAIICRTPIQVSHDVASDSIDFDTLSQLPPCEAQVRILPLSWLATADELNRVKPRHLSLVYHDEEFGIMGRPFWQVADLSRYHGQIHLLTFTDAVVEVERLPRTLAKLHLINGEVHGADKFHEFTQLEELFIHCENRRHQRLAIPPHVTRLRTSFDWMYLDHTRYNHEPDAVTDIPWHQFKYLHTEVVPKVKCLDNVEEWVINSPPPAKISLIDIECPKLERVTIEKGFYLGFLELSLVFTHQQMAQLTVLEAPEYIMPDVKLLPLLRKLAIATQEKVTEDMALPPQVEELLLYTDSIVVEGVPSQIKKFAINYAQSSHRRSSVNGKITIALCTLHSLTIEGGNFVSFVELCISCPNLHWLNMRLKNDRFIVDAPELVLVTYQGNCPHWFDTTQYPRLAHATLVPP